MIEQNVLPFKLELTNERLTPHVGLVLTHEFNRGLGLGGLLDKHLPWPGSNRGYSASEVVLPLVLMLFGGGRDLDDISVIAKDHALCEASGLSDVPASTTLGDWLRRTGGSKSSMSGLARVVDCLTLCRHRRDARTDYTLDVDATIIGADKQDATRAYDGTLGYHPMLGFLDETRWLIHEEFRTGSASPQSGGVEFITACRRRMPKGKRITEVRSDSAFYNHMVTDYCQQEGMTYTIGADWDSAVQAAYDTLPAGSWSPLPVEKGEPWREVAETVHAMNEGDHSFRLVFVRDIDRQRHLFASTRHGRGIITNAPADKRTTASVVAHYNRRGTMENYIKELKHGFGMLRMPCGQEHANAAWFRIGALAYNLFLLQQAFALPPEMLHATVGTIRWHLYQVAARLVRHARRLVLKVATDATTFAILTDLRLVARSLAFP